MTASCPPRVNRYRKGRGRVNNNGIFWNNSVNILNNLYCDGKNCIPHFLRYILKYCSISSLFCLSILYWPETITSKLQYGIDPRLGTILDGGSMRFKSCTNTMRYSKQCSVVFCASLYSWMYSSGGNGGVDFVGYLFLGDIKTYDLKRTIHGDYSMCQLYCRPFPFLLVNNVPIDLWSVPTRYCSIP